MADLRYYYPSVKTQVPGESKINTFKRLCHLERRFQRNLQLQIQISFIDEYIKLGSHICIVWYQGYEN